MKTGTREWSEHSVNIQVGCENGCRYCYARDMAVRFDRCKYHNWTKPIPSPMPVVKRRAGVTMFPTTHDLTEDNFPRVREAIRIITEGFKDDDRLLIVTKPEWYNTMRVANYIMNDLPEGTMKKVEWRVTIGTLDKDTMKFWEPNASDPECRLGLIYFLKQICGFKTSISIEPYLSDDTWELVKAVYQHADEIWIGRMNQIDQRVRIASDDEEGQERLAEIKRLSSDDYIKRTLYRQLDGIDTVRWKDSIRKVMS